MRQIVIGETLATEGVEFDQEEKSTVLFAIGIYMKLRQMFRGIEATEASNETLNSVTELSDEVCADLQDEGNVLLVGAGKELSELALKILETTHTACPTEIYGSMCEALSVKPFDMIWHGLTAGKMLGDQREITLL